jgi:type IV pilus assembly protein PilC
MSTYLFKARDQSGALVTGEIDADTSAGAKDQVAAQGLFPIDVELQGTFAQNVSFSFLKRKPSPKDIANMTRQFQALFAVGTPMDRILSLLAKQLQNQALKEAMVKIQKDVASGTKLSAAFKAFPQYFPTLYISMMEVGETGGVLDQTLKEMASILQKEAEIRSKVKSAMLYPKIVLFVLGAVTWGMLAFVIPPFKTFYAGHGAELPAVTRIVITFSDLMTGSWYIGLGIGVALYWAWKRFSATELGENLISHAAFRIPVFGRLNRLTANSRFGHLLSSLYRAGVPITQALGVVANTMTNVHYARDVLSIKKGLEQGSSLSKCMENTKYFEPMIQESISVGEKTGQLDLLLDSTATFYDAEIDDMLKNMSTLIEPILLVFLFSGVTVLALAIYLPIWNLSKVIIPK